MGANEIDRIAARYRALRERVPLKPVTTKAGYEAAVGHLNRLLDAGGANQAHRLALKSWAPSISAAARWCTVFHPPA